MDELKPSGTTDTLGSPQGTPSINAPKIESTKTLKSTRPAISSVDQIYAICEQMFRNDSERNFKNGVLASLLNSAPPFSQGEHKSKGQGYRHNFSTGFLAGVCDPVVSFPVDVIDQATYLTSASLDNKDDPQGTKTEAYRRKFTRLVRNWEGWRDLIYAIAQEDVHYGYLPVLADDPDDWPEMLTQEEFGVPDNTGQIAKKCQFFGRKKSFFIHELIEVVLRQPETSDTPWDREVVVNCLNESMPHNRTQEGNAQAPTTRTWVDLIRDGNSGASYDPEARTVDCYILYACEADGKVSKFIVPQKYKAIEAGKDTRKSLYESFDEFESMSEMLVFFALKPAKTLFSSKGMARDLGNVAQATERGRCKAADATWLGSLVWMHSEKGMCAAQLKIGDTAAIIGSEAKIVSDALPDRSEAFDKFDERMTRYAEQAVGQYITSKPSQSDVSRSRTAHEVEREWQMQQQQRSGWLKRFFGQFGDMMTVFAKLIGNPSTKNEAWKEFQKDLEENDGITPEQLKKLANQNQGQMVVDMLQTRTQAMVQALPMVKASPYWNQKTYEEEVAVRTLGKEIVDRHFIKDASDPNDEGQAIREQMGENNDIRNGESPPVLPKDNHKGHLKYLVTTLDRSEPKIDQKVQIGQILQGEQPILDNHQTAVKHGDAHVSMWKQQAEANQNQDDLKMIGQFEGRLKQSQDKQDAWLKAALAMKQKQMQDAADSRAASAEAMKRMPAPSNGQSPQQPQGPIYTDENILKAWIAHVPDLEPDLQAQVAIISGLKVPEHLKENGAVARPLMRKPLTKEEPQVTQRQVPDNEPQEVS